MTASAMYTFTNADRKLLFSSAQHWHSDHSGGILQALKLITEAKHIASSSSSGETIVDLHPNRPEARGIWPPQAPAPIIRLPDDPTFEEIEAAGGKVDKHAEAHTLAGGTAFVSGEIRRQTSFETGLLGGTQWVDGAWQNAPDNPGRQIMDERFLMMDIKDKGLVIFSSCSRESKSPPDQILVFYPLTFLTCLLAACLNRSPDAGIVNVCKSALEASNEKRPILAVIGGYHLGGTGMEERIPDTVKFFSEELQPRATYLVPMHCTGFKAKVALANALGDCVIPAGSGSRITF
jgi:7,8-dihydropterin-6-yl-methyl-4-(beta-D-ribofuranosyl)aminobenzene 5'-phosphate synthase